MTLNLGSMLDNSAKRNRAGVAMKLGSTDYSYDELDSLARRFASELRASGIEPGDRVGLMSPNVPFFSVAYFGILYAGGIAVTLNSLLSADEVEFQLNDCQAKALVFHSAFVDAAHTGFSRATGCHLLYAIDLKCVSDCPDAKPLEATLEQTPTHADLYQTMPDDTAVILYTSGTTGVPKGAELTHFNLFYNAQCAAERVFSLWPDEIRVLKHDDVGLAVLPLYHIFGQTSIQNALIFGGGAVSYVRRFDVKETVRIIKEHKITVFAGVPTIFFALLNDSEGLDVDLSSLRAVVVGGAPLPVEVKEEFFKKYGVHLQEGYGLTETSPLATVQRRNEATKAGTPGKPIVGIDLKIFDPDDNEVPQGERGEIVMRGHNIMKGYFNRPEATAEAMRNGWFHTGDVGYIDVDGDLRIVDRMKDMIIRGGYNVYSREVEEVLYAHPEVREAAIIGVPSDRYGEEIKAIVAMKSGATATSESIIAFCKEHLAAYKYPRIVEIIDDLPKGPTGKILKRALK